MSIRSRLPMLLAVTLLGASLSACFALPTGSASKMDPVPGFVTDLAQFDAYIQSHPTPEQFRLTYPDVQLVLPGQIATKELRFNNSRYFAKLDEDGRIVGGRFG